VKAPGFDDDLGFCARSEPLDAQALVAQLAVEATAELSRFWCRSPQQLLARIEAICARS
jgi:hypothetical protein